MATCWRHDFIAESVSCRATFYTTADRTTTAQIKPYSKCWRERDCCMPGLAVGLVIYYTADWAEFAAGWNSQIIYHSRIVDMTLEITCDQDDLADSARCSMNYTRPWLIRLDGRRTHHCEFTGFIMTRRDICALSILDVFFTFARFTDTLTYLLNC